MIFTRGNNHMRDPKDVLFGPVPDEQRDYWQRNKLAQRDAALLDRHFDPRFRQQFMSERDSGLRAYSIPRSQKVVLRETPGGLPVFDGSFNVWDERYAQAQSQFASRANTSNLPDPFQGRRPGMVEEVDAGALLQQRMMGQMSRPPTPQHGAMPGHAMVTGQQSFQQPAASVVTLHEGHTFYTPLQIQGFGTTQPLAKTGGQIKGVQGRQFQVEGQVNAYVIDGLQTIDLSKMEPQRLKPLVRVSAPLLGTFLVPQEAIQEMSGGPGATRGLLIDHGNHRQDQRAMWAQQQAQAQAQAQQQQQQARSLLITQPQGRQPMPQQQPARPMNQQEMFQAQQREMLRRRGLLKG
jgi:hypothetical protein